VATHRERVSVNQTRNIYAAADREHIAGDVPEDVDVAAETLHDVRSAVRADYDIAKKLRPILRIFRRSLERSGGKRAQNEKKQEDGNGENMFPVQPSSSFAPAAGEYQGGDYRFLERSTLVLSEEANQVKSRRIFFAYRAK
jgi:hypothetical protein